jgi:hypothetical protein
MDTNGMICVALTVHFGVDTAVMTFPYLGQATFMGHIEALLAGSRAKPPRLFIPVCVSPEVKEYMDRALDEGRLAEAGLQGIPVDVPQVGFATTAGLRMCAEIRRLLATPKAETTGLRGIAAELEQEASALTDLLAGGGYRNLTFHLEFEECQNPPAPLLAWVAKDMAELWTDVDRLLAEIENEKGNA